jgi:hypothetical protein
VVGVAEGAIRAGLVMPTPRGGLWARWQAGTRHDPDILDLPPEERSIWSGLIELATESSKRGEIKFTDAQLARDLHLSEESVTHAVDHFAQRGKLTRKDDRLVLRNFKVFNPPARFVTPSQRNGHGKGD